MKTKTAATPGWYPAPDMPNTQRYWDGYQWTPQYAPGAPAEADHMGLMWVSTGLAVLFPIGGLIGGAVLMSKGRAVAGGCVIVLALFATMWWFNALAN